MKKWIIGIIVLFSFFSIANAADQTEGLLERLLDINYGPEHYEIELSSLDMIYFSDQNTNRQFQEINQVNETLKDQLMLQYRAWNLDHNRMSAIVSVHQKFIYHLNKFFYFLSLKEKGYNYKELDTSILKNYKLVRVYYKKIKYFTLKK